MLTVTGLMPNAQVVADRFDVTPECLERRATCLAKRTGQTFFYYREQYFLLLIARALTPTNLGPNFYTE